VFVFSAGGSAQEPPLSIGDVWRTAFPKIGKFFERHLKEGEK